VTEREDIRLVDALYGEQKKDEKVDEAELESYAKMLSVFRAVEDEEPSPHLDALILAHARQVADETRAASIDKGLRGFLRRVLRSPIAGVAVVTSLVVVIAVPALVLTQRSAEMARAPMSEVSKVAAPAPSAEPDRKALDPAANKEMQARIAPEETAAKADEDRLDVAEEANEGGAERAQPRGEVAHRRVRAQRQSHGAPKADRAAKGGDVADRLTGLQRNEYDAKKPAPPPLEEKRAKPAEKAEAPKKKEALAFDDAQKDSRTRDQERPASAASAGPAPTSPPATAEAPAQAPAGGAVGDGEAPPRAKATEQQSNAPVALSAPADKTADLGVAASYPGDMIRAAEQQLRAGDPQGARNVLFTALARTEGTPGAGEVELAIGRLELGQKRYSEAIAHGRAAYGTRGFRKKLEALNVVHQAAQAIGSKSDLAWEESERVRAVKAVR
jgi:hypothetical protein